jgi:mRNA-degrading endonuclease toxin of MazEF toxin-antitoxin module
MRGDVHRYRPDRAATAGHEQSGERIAVIVQNDNLAALSTWLIVPCSTSVAPGPTRARIKVAEHDTYALAEQLRAVDPSVRLGERLGHLTLAEMQAVDSALRTVLGLN